MDQAMRPERDDSNWDRGQTSRNLHEAIHRFFTNVQGVEPVGSAAHLLRVVADGGNYVLREWAAGTAAAQVNLTQLSLQIAATAGDGLLPTPRPARGEPEVWAVEVGGHLVTAASWLPGRPLSRYGDYRTPDDKVIDVPLPASAPAESIVLEAVRAIGRFHSVTALLAAESGTSKTTLARLLDSSRTTWNEQRKLVGDRAANSPEIRRWLRCGNRIVPVAAEHLEQFGRAGAASCIVHGDIWPANFLIEGSAAERTLTGVVGWSSVAIGSPLIDLAHLAIHTSSWSGALAESILGAYTEVATLSPGERRLLPVVAALDLVPRVGWLLNLAYVDDRMIGHESQPILRSGLKSLLMSLENLTQVLAPDAEWDQRKTSETRRSREGGAVRRIRPTGTRPGRPPGSGRSRPGPRPGRPRTG